jgi:hypothetical protein
MLDEQGMDRHRTVVRASPQGSRDQRHLQSPALVEAIDLPRTRSVRWALYLISLKNLVETGACTPGPRDIQS